MNGIIFLTRQSNSGEWKNDLNYSEDNTIYVNADGVKGNSYAGVDDSKNKWIIWINGNRNEGKENLLSQILEHLGAKEILKHKFIIAHHGWDIGHINSEYIKVDYSSTETIYKETYVPLKDDINKYFEKAVSGLLKNYGKVELEKIMKMVIESVAPINIGIQLGEMNGDLEKLRTFFNTNDPSVAMANLAYIVDGRNRISRINIERDIVEENISRDYSNIVTLNKFELHTGSDYMEIHKLCGCYRGNILTGSVFYKIVESVVRSLNDDKNSNMTELRKTMTKIRKAMTEWQISIVNKFKEILENQQNGFDK